MALDRNDRSAAISPDSPPPVSASRLCLRPSLPGGHGTLDGGWWPRSRDPSGDRLTLLVVPPEATAEQAAIALAMAALEGNSAHPAAVLAASGLTAVEPAAASMARHPSAQHRSSSPVRPSTRPAGEARVPPLL